MMLAMNEYYNVSKYEDLPLIFKTRMEHDIKYNIDNGITEIEEITFTIQMIDPNRYETLAKSQELRVIVGQ